VLEYAKIVFCAESDALWRATFFRCSECLQRMLFWGIAAIERWKQIAADCTQKLVTRR